MKKLLLGGVAVAAITLAVEGPAKAAPPSAYSWTGCYIGGNAGGAWAHKDFVTGDRAPQGTGEASMGSFAGGGQFGCDVQYGMWVMGAQGLFDWSDIRGADPFFNGKRFAIHIPWFATATGRIGYLAQPALLVYFRGGAAFVRDHFRLEEPPAFVDAIGSQTRTGLLLGGGFEWMFAPYWSVYVEFNYMGFGTKGVNFQGQNGFPDAFEVIRQRADAVLFGVNYHFNSGRP